MARKKARRRKPIQLPKRLLRAGRAARAGRCATARRLMAKQKTTRAPQHLVKMVKKAIAKHCR